MFLIADAMRPATMKNIIHEFLISRIKNSRITFHILAEKSLSQKFYGTKNVSVYKSSAVEECWPKIRVERAPERYRPELIA